MKPITGQNIFPHRFPLLWFSHDLNLLTSTIVEPFSHDIPSKRKRPRCVDHKHRLESFDVMFLIQGSDVAEKSNRCLAEKSHVESAAIHHDTHLFHILLQLTTLCTHTVQRVLRRMYVKSQKRIEGTLLQDRIEFRLFTHVFVSVCLLMSVFL